MAKVRHHYGCQNENGARKSPVEEAVIRQIEKGEDKLALETGLRLMVAAEGREWAVVRLAAATGLSLRTVENVMARFGMVPEMNALLS